MEKAMVIALLERYWQAETTVAEETLLAEYFRQAEDPDPGLAPYRDLFLYFGEEAQVTAGPGFEARILKRLRMGSADVSERAGAAEGSDQAGMNATERAGAGRSFRMGFVAAAAVIGALVAGLFLSTPRQSHDQQRVAVAPVTIKDTYDDPGQALAAVRHALLVASTHLNEGRRSLTGDKR